MPAPTRHPRLPGDAISWQTTITVIRSDDVPLVQATEDLFIAQGYASTSIDKIAVAALDVDTS
jgi:hypothetical protein